ncbi:helix-turn-helix domain-containing protein [Pelomicrobium sp. G1]|uniref:helix-turn-helix domain-containing protein n=1 Tax=unclassified Pelomicrobium TaxID=2815318 RepID=UPI0021DD43DB|nr:MAG: hypothetical protein KatS3mg123_0287 [Burkholderiales bacterium]
MNKRNIGREIIEGLEELAAWTRGKAELATHEVTLPTAEDVPHIRKELKLSQDAFAGLLGVSVGTLRNWEQRRREPQGPARSLLYIVSKEPDAVLRAFRDPSPDPRAGIEHLVAAQQAKAAASRKAVPVVKRAAAKKCALRKGPLKRGRR